ncbi:glycoside hydrolase family 2 TIM barrel-domain containing protein [Saccharopolyspora sp. NPDC002578]
MTARRVNALDGAWSFGPLEPGADPGAVPDELLGTAIVPHVVAELSWRDWDPASWERDWLYRKRFAGAGEPGRRYFLRFAGVLTTTRPILNGRPLEPHGGGYLPFDREVTGLLAARNVLDVVVDGRFDADVPPNSDRPSDVVDFWQPAGLHREVALVARPADHVRDVFAKPVRVLDDARRGLVVRCELDLVDGGPAQLRAQLRDADRPVAEAEREVDLGPGRGTAELVLDGLSGVRLWDPDSPHLYDVVVTLRRAGRVVDEHQVRTGFREVRFDRDGFRLNGERLRLFGVNRHQLFPFAGAAMPARVQRRDAEILRRELNCTMVRCSHYPPHEAFLDACDELGLLVWDEPPGWQHLGSGRWLERAHRDVHDMIVRDRNHPSVVLWAARLNETPGDAEFYGRTERLAKSLDDSRPTTGAILGADHATTDFQHDVFGYNDYSASTGPDGLPQPEPEPPRRDLPYLISEAVGTLSGPARFYRRTDPQAVQQGQALAHARVHDLAGADPAYAGVLAWAGFDYPSGHGNIDRGVKWPGVVDLFRVPKPGAAMYRAQVDPRRRPVIEPSFHWDLTGPSPVRELGEAAIWSNVDRLELFVGGEPFGALTAARERYPNLPYPPFLADFGAVRGIPELRVDGYLDDRMVLTRRFSADRSADRLVLRPDDRELVAGGADATRVEIRVVDRYGADRPHTAGDVELDLTGPAELVGPARFPLAETGGVGAVWLRSARSGTGRVRLRALHPSAGEARTELTVTAS